MTGERAVNGRMLECLLEQVEKNCWIERMILDGVYDSRRSFSYLADEIRSSDKGDEELLFQSRGCPARNRIVLEYRQSPEDFKRPVSYGNGGWLKQGSPVSSECSVRM